MSAPDVELVGIYNLGITHTIISTVSAALSMMVCHILKMF